jgi:hypothetical protein
MTLADHIRAAIRPCTTDVLGMWLPSVAQRKPEIRAQTHIVRWPGLASDARTLGVSRFHLYRVLKGERRSHRLMVAYTELSRAAKETLPSSGTKMKPQHPSAQGGA